MNAIKEQSLNKKLVLPIKNNNECYSLNIFFLAL